ncbi:hypothetical protein Tco_0478954 [Tanacetum coccineum]
MDFGGNELVVGKQRGRPRNTMQYLIRVHRHHKRKGEGLMAVEGSNDLQMLRKIWVAEIKEKYGEGYKSITNEQINEFLDELFYRTKKEITGNQAIISKGNGVKSRWVLSNLNASTSKVCKFNETQSKRKKIASEVKRPNSEFKRPKVR